MMGEINWEYLLGGKESVNRELRYKEGIHTIEQKYISFFKERNPHPLKQFEEHDHLHNHLFMEKTNNHIKIVFSEELPENIRIECTNLIHQIWK